MLVIVPYTFIALQNKGKNCWSHCNGQQGPCSWCGTEGMCCTKKPGWTDTSNGCDGTFGGLTGHKCFLKGKTRQTPKYFEVLNTFFLDFSTRNIDNNIVIDISGEVCGLKLCTGTKKCCKLQTCEDLCLPNLPDSSTWTCEDVCPLEVIYCPNECPNGGKIIHK